MTSSIVRGAHVQVLRLFRRGATISEIAEALDLSKNAVEDELRFVFLPKERFFVTVRKRKGGTGRVFKFLPGKQQRIPTRDFRIIDRNILFVRKKWPGAEIKVQFVPSISVDKAIQRLRKTTSRRDLTERRKKVAELTKGGMKTREIAAVLSVSPTVVASDRRVMRMKTIGKHIRRLLPRR